MRFREQIVKYDIDKHGSAYVDYSTPIYICPECSSSDAKLKKGCSSTYACPDCGCEFRARQCYEVTKSGKTMQVILSVLLVLCALGVIGGLIGPVIFMIYQERMLGHDLSRQLYSTDCTIAVFAIPLVCILLGTLFSKLYDKI